MKLGQVNTIHIQLHDRKGKKTKTITVYQHPYTEVVGWVCGLASSTPSSKKGGTQSIYVQVRDDLAKESKTFTMHKHTLDQVMEKLVGFIQPKVEIKKE